MAFPSQPAAPSPLIASWAAAIYGLEDPSQNHVATRNNNPGNIMTGSSYNVYATMADGWMALYGDLGAKLRKYPGRTLDQVMQSYAPDSTNYGQWVANHLNQDLGTAFTGSTTLAELAGITTGGFVGPLPLPDSGDYSDSGGASFWDAPFLVPDSPGDSWMPWAVLAAGVVAYAVG